MPPVPTIVTGQKPNLLALNESTPSNSTDSSFKTAGKVAGHIALPVAGGLGGAGLGALVGTLVAPGVGTVIGAAVGAGLGGGTGEAAAQKWIEGEENLHWGPIIAMGTLSGMTAGASSLLASIGRGVVRVGENVLWRGTVKTAEVMTAAGKSGVQAIGQRAAVNVGQGTLYRGIDAAVDGKTWRNVVNPASMSVDVIAGELIFRGAVKAFGVKTIFKKAEDFTPEIRAQSQEARSSAILFLNQEWHWRLDGLEGLPRLVGFPEVRKKIGELGSVLKLLRNHLTKQSAETIDSGFSVWVIDKWLYKTVLDGIHSYRQQLSANPPLAEPRVWVATQVQKLSAFLDEQISAAQFFLRIIPNQGDPFTKAIDATAVMSPTAKWTISLSGVGAGAIGAGVVGLYRFDKHLKAENLFPIAAYASMAGRDVSFDEVYDRVDRLHAFTQKLKFAHIDEDGTELEFKPVAWQVILPALSGNGEFTPEKLHRLAYDLYAVIHRLMEKDPKPSNPIGVRCGGKNIYGFNYEENLLPEAMRAKVRELVKRYQESVGFLSRYTEIECEDSIFSSDKCPPLDEISLSRARFFSTINLDTKTRDLLTGFCSSSACFTGNVYLQTKEGEPIAFDDLAAKAKRGEGLPVFTSFDEKLQRVVYQQPTIFFDHANRQSVLWYLQLEDSQQQTFTLPVTEEHPLFVEREGKRRWSRVAELRDGDFLLGPNQEHYRFHRDASRVVHGAFNVYNLSFSARATDQIPTYLVSPDGTHWLIAHNFK